MKIGMIGLGRMGGKMAERLMQHGHAVVGYANDRDTVEAFEGAGGRSAPSVAALVEVLERPRVIWLMVPAGAAVEQTIETLAGLLSPEDVIVDGGNSYYKDTIQHAAALRQDNIRFVDVGTSGGIWGLENGYSLMVGGEPEVVKRVQPLFEALAPAPDRGWAHVGPSGSGHFVKMVHNGIEYGMMQAFAEGFHILQKKTDFGLDLPAIAEVWRHGSVVRSWLLDLMADALKKNPSLDGILPRVADSGEGRWTVAEAIELNVAAPVITHSLITRLRSRDEDSFADRLLAVTRQEFGGHAVAKDTKNE